MDEANSVAGFGQANRGDQRYRAVSIAGRFEIDSVQKGTCCELYPNFARRHLDVAYQAADQLVVFRANSLRQFSGERDACSASDLLDRFSDTRIDPGKIGFLDAVGRHDVNRIAERANQEVALAEVF